MKRDAIATLIVKLTEAFANFGFARWHPVIIGTSGCTRNPSVGHAEAFDDGQTARLVLIELDA